MCHELLSFHQSGPWLAANFIPLLDSAWKSYNLLGLHWDVPQALTVDVIGTVAFGEQFCAQTDKSVQLTCSPELYNWCAHGAGKRLLMFSCAPNAGAMKTAEMWGL